MNTDDERIEALLRADRATPVRDDGFVAHLLIDLPPRRRARPAWIAPVMTTVGCVLAVLSLGGPQATLSLLSTEVARFIPLVLLLPVGGVLISFLWALSGSR
jgi:hypothetical protein